MENRRSITEGGMKVLATDKDIVIEKGNWIARKIVGTAPNFAVKRKENPSNKLVPLYPVINIELYFETDAKLLVKLLARLEKLAVASLKQIRNESRALRTTAMADEIRGKEAMRLFGKQEAQLTTSESEALTKALASPSSTKGMKELMAVVDLTKIVPRLETP